MRPASAARLPSAIPKGMTSFSTPAKSADEGVRADANELMRGRAAAQYREIADLAMARQHDVVRQNDVVADAGSRARHGRWRERRSASRRSSREPPPAVPGFIVTPSRMMQSSPIVRRHRLAAIFEVLRLVADRSERENARARADRRVARRGSRGKTRRTPSPSIACGADMAERADLDVFAEPGARLDASGRMPADARCSDGSRRHRSFRHQHRRNLRLANEHAVDSRFAAEPPHVAALGDSGHVKLAPDRPERRACGISPCRRSSDRRRPAWPCRLARRRTAPPPFAPSPRSAARRA